MQRILHASPESELGKRLEEAATEQKPLRIISGGAVYDVQAREYASTPRAEQDRELARVRHGLARSSGALHEVDLAALKQELLEAREQGAKQRLR